VIPSLNAWGFNTYGRDVLMRILSEMVLDLNQRGIKSKGPGMFVLALNAVGV